MVGWLAACLARDGVCVYICKINSGRPEKYAEVLCLILTLHVFVFFVRLVVAAAAALVPKRTKLYLDGDHRTRARTRRAVAVASEPQKLRFDDLQIASRVRYALSSSLHTQKIQNALANALQHVVASFTC